MNILITGGSGFVGGYVYRYFEQQNYVSAAAGFEQHESTSAKLTEVRDSNLGLRIP